MTLLGAVLAGGASSRFGSDKAEALLDGETMIDRIIARVRPQVDAVVICGRERSGLVSLPDRPHHGLGPLGAINAALHWGAEHGYGAVLSVPCDTPLLPHDLVAQLGDAPAYHADIPVIGLWPSACAEELARFLVTDATRSMRRWGQAIGAVPRRCTAIVNINTQNELAALAAQRA